VAKKAAKKTAKKAKAAPKKTARPKLLSGGNPQIAKGYGDAPVQAYIAAVPDWRRDIVKRLDTLITKAIPRVRKAVKWNSPFYGMSDNVWFLSIHVYAKYVQVAFFRGSSLKPPPEKKSKYPAVRYHDIHEGELDEKQLTAWVKQASKLPGEKM
jgi:hypothetical protein